MVRKVYLEGEIADIYGKEHEVVLKRAADFFSYLEANFSNVKRYLIDCAEKGVNFTIFCADKSYSEEELLLSLEEGDLYITALPQGSSGGGGKIVAAVAIAAVAWYALPLLAAGSGGLAAGTAGTSAAWAGMSAGWAAAGQLAMGLAINLAMTGIAELMAPDPSVDENDESYLFNGPAQNIVAGDPIPILYGQLRVPGQPISFEIVNSGYRDNTDLSSYYTSPFGFTFGTANLAVLNRY